MNPLNTPNQNKGDIQPLPTTTDAPAPPPPLPTPNERSLFASVFWLFWVMIGLVRVMATIAIHIINLPLTFIMSSVYQIRWFIWLDCSLKAFLADDHDMYAHQKAFMIKIRPITMSASVFVFEATWHPIYRLSKYIVPLFVGN